MSISAISSLTTISPANWFSHQKVTYLFGSSFSPPGKFFYLRAYTYQDRKYQVHPVASHRTTLRKETNPKTLNSRASQITKLDRRLVIQYPIVTESTVKAILENNTLVFIVDKHADKNDVKGAVWDMFHVKAEKVNTSILPDGTKKAYVRLGQDYNAIDVAKKIGIL